MQCLEHNPPARRHRPLLAASLDLAARKSSRLLLFPMCSSGSNRGLCFVGLVLPPRCGPAVFQNAPGHWRNRDGFLQLQQLAAITK